MIMEKYKNWTILRLLGVKKANNMANMAECGGGGSGIQCLCTFQQNNVNSGEIYNNCVFVFN